MWSELPYHLLEVIIDKLLMTTYITVDYIRFGAVCTSWRKVYIHHSHPDLLLRHRRGLPPFLIVPAPSPPSSSKKKKNKKKKKTNIISTKSLSFYNIIHKKIYNDKFKLTISSNTHFRGSSHGWLVEVEQGDYDCQVRLFNPFINNTILLPSTKNLPVHKYPCFSAHSSPSSYAYLRKAVLSADPLTNPTDYIVMAIFGGLGRLAFYKPSDGNEKWTLVEIESSKYSHQFHDVMYYGGMFIALNIYGVVLFLDPTLNMKVITKTSPPPRPQSLPLLPGSVYLFEASGHLFQVQRFMQLGRYDHVAKRQYYKTSKFRVMMFQEEGINGYQWMDTKTLGHYTLFLGNSDTMCIWTPTGCKPNSIYFTDDDYYYRNGFHDLGIFNIEDGTIENHYPTDQYTPIGQISIWIQPGIQKTGGGEDINNNY